MPVSGQATHIVEQCAGPAHDMESVGAADGVGRVFLHALVDPARSVAADGRAEAILLRQLLEELAEDLLAVAFMDPNDGVGVVIDDDSDLFMPFA